MRLEPDFVHPKFKLNGFHFTAEDLSRVAYSFIKEGEAYEKAVGGFILDWFDEKPYVEMKTSGTTGTPKIVRLQKQHMVNSALATADFFDVGINTRALHCLPSQFVAGKMMLVRAFILGWDMDLVAPSSTPLERNDTVYDFAAMVPLQAQESLPKLGQVKKLILGGAKVSDALAMQLQELTTQIWETYAMTETITHVAAKKVGDAAFTVLPNISIATDERGCLIIKAPLVADADVVTNDVVEITDQSHFIWLGRYDNVINSGGIKLHPEQIEHKIQPYINRRSFIYSLPDATLGHKIVLVIEGGPYAIDDKIFEGLDKYEKPKDILFAREFVETGSGKIKREDTVFVAISNK